MVFVKKASIVPLLVALFALSLAPQVPAVDVGQKAPDFDLDSSKGGKLKLSSLRGKNVLINFYGRDYDPT
jgi:hypothetical protein